MATKGGITKRYLASLALNPSTCEKTRMSLAAIAEPETNGRIKAMGRSKGEFRNSNMPKNLGLKDR